MYVFECSPVYYANKQSNAKVIINQGGTDSGKSYAIMQILIEVATTTKPPQVDPIITVVGESVPNLKKGAYRIARSIIGGTVNLDKYIHSWNETDRTIYFKSGWIMEFVSYQDEQSAKQGKRQYLFVNEANGLSYPIFWQLAKRTRVKVFLDYNPSSPFWAHEKLIGTTKESNDLFCSVDLIISDHRHNPFLSQDEHDKTENIKDPNLWKVYARGMTGNLTGLVYPNWRRIPDSQYPQEAEIWGGLDFGYTNDPTAGVKICSIGDNIFLHELCYTPGISSPLLKELFFANGFEGSTEVFCENDNDKIRELRRCGMMALLARKGPNSVKPQIQKVNEFNVFYTESSFNLHTEKTKYMYIIDPLTGKPTNVPIDNFNHLMDAARYGIYTKKFREG